jgi:hypothetical protein
MVTALLLAALVIAVGSRAGDNLRVRQQEIVLSKLPVPEKYEYYDVIRSRVRKVMILRAIATLSLLSILFSYKHYVFRRAERARATITAPAPPPPLRPASGP